MNFLQRFQQTLVSLSISPVQQTITVAYSGGLDSHALLSACYAAGLSIRAIHIHHGLQTEADVWVQHCRDICQSLAIPLDVYYVDACPVAGQSPEEAARIARYRAIEQVMQAGDILFTAQHLDDQAETFLLQLMRGGGAAGLAAMPVSRPFGAGRLIRPLLSFSRAEIYRYACQQKLSWVDDPSNADTQFDRNYIRHSVIPALQQRWQACKNSLSQAASQQQDNLEIIEAMAAIDLAAVITRQPEVLNLSVLMQLSTGRQKNMLRYWLRSMTKQAPPQTILNEIINAVLYAAIDARPLIQWQNFEIRRFQNKLYLSQNISRFDPTQTFIWQPVEPLCVENAGIRLRTVNSDNGPRFKIDLINKPLQIRFRQGGERIQPVGRKHHYRVKSLFQQAGIPPWERNKIPFLYFEDKLIAVGNRWYAAHYCAGGNEPGWQLQLDSLPVKNKPHREAYLVDT